MRNVYVWMARPRLQGYRKQSRKSYNTEFDRWMREIDMNTREVATALDIPEQRVIDLRAGWRDGRINGAMVPSFATRYAMAALLAGLRPVIETPDCYDLRDRLAQAAHDAGLEPWPQGEKFTTNPYARGDQRANRLLARQVAAKASEPAPAPAKKPRKRVLQPRPRRDVAGGAEA